jgi:hypothetical protein
MIVRRGTVARDFGPRHPLATAASHPSLICFSHLRWAFVFQRPQHLMRRAARNARVFYWEEPLFGDSPAPVLEGSLSPEGVWVLTPILPHGTDAAASLKTQRTLLDAFVAREAIENPILWY